MKLLKIIGIIFALLVALLLLAPAFISADFLKAQLIAQVKAATGRALTIEGATSLKLFPEIAVAAEKVTLGNPAGFASPYFVKLEKLSVGAALRPLLQKQLRVTGITLEGASLNLEKSAAGAANWTFVSGAPTKKANAVPTEKGAAPALSIGDIRLSNSAVTYRVAGAAPISVTGIELTLRGAGSAQTTLDLRNANLFGGSAKGTVLSSGAPASPALAVDMNFSGIQIEPLLVTATGASKLTGTGDLTLDVKTKGATQAAMMAALNGNGALKLRDGAIKGTNIGQLLREAKQGFMVKNNEQRSTDFTELTASFSIVNGLLSNNDLAMKAPALRLAGSGSTSLAAKTIDYRLVPTIVGTFKGQGGKDTLDGVAVPILVTGSWANPSIRPDMAGLLEQGLKNPEALSNAVRGVGDALKNPKDIGGLLKGF